MPAWLSHLLGTIVDGVSYDLVKVALGSLVVAIAGAAIGKITNRLESLKEAIYIGSATSYL